MKKLQNAMIQAFLRARAEMLRLENEEEGLETVETVILVAVAVIVAGAIINVLTGDDGKSGLISTLFNGIKTKIGSVFGIEFDG